MGIKVPNAGTGLVWTDTATWQGGSIPVDADDVVFEPGKTYVFAAFSQPNIELASLVALDCHLELPGEIDVQNSGRGLLARLRSGCITLTGETNILSAEGPGTVVNVVSGPNLVVQCLGGAQVNLQAGGTYEDVLVDGHGSQVTIGTHASDRVKLKIGPGCRVESYRKVEEALIMDGTLALMGAVANITDGSTGGVAKLFGPNAVLSLEQTAALSHALIEGYAGLVDASKARAVQTVTADVQSPMCRFIERGIAGSMVRSSPTRRGLTDVFLGLDSNI